MSQLGSVSLEVVKEYIAKQKGKQEIGFVRSESFVEDNAKPGERLKQTIGSREAIV